MSDTRHDQPHDPPPEGPDDLGALYLEYATRLRRVVGSRVTTSDTNLDDACGFAWTQLIATRPRRDSIFAWLVTVATREAWRLDRLSRRDAGEADDFAPEALEHPTAEALAQDRIEFDEVLENPADDPPTQAPDAHAPRRRLHLRRDRTRVRRKPWAGA